MSTELMATIIGTTVTIVALVVTIYFTNRSTQKILRGHDKILERVAHGIYDIAHLTEKVASHSEVEFELGGVKIAENIQTKEEAERLGEVIKYNPKLKLCYYKPKKSSG
ncbi:MAG: hypothetical protein QME47_08080 [Candidatus Thermoplasmatota archaeon]|nr:hypothetical protein [Candidatus Thermoplasmatota archaeon]